MERHRLRISYDVIYEGPRLSPSASRRVAEQACTLGHVLAFEDVKNVTVEFLPDKTVYAHHHDSSGDYCRIRNGCLEQASDGLNQDL
jgi:hypothetical protein